MNIRVCKLTALIVAVGLGLIGIGRAAATVGFDGARPLPPIPTELFSPSNARTADGQLIPVAEFIPAARCAQCHQDTHAAWSESLHRNAAREPFYRESADILLRTRGIEFTRHCESCHTPIALFSGALSRTSGRAAAPFTSLDDEGVTCTICHSITEARLDGTGSFTIRRPALLADADGTPRYGDFTDAQILADIAGHKRAVMRPLLRAPEFCAVCHKVDAPPSLNGYKHIRGFSAYDEWQQSGASHEAVMPFYRRAQRTDCRACHMPKIASAHDRAAKEGKIASHRWLGANTAAPLFYGQQAQADATAQFLKADVVEVDIFALREGASGTLLAPLANNAAPEQRSVLTPGAEVTVEVVISNRNAAHTFPPEVRDLYEAWVEFEAVDAAGKTIFHSGFLKPDGVLDERAHVYKQIILDEQGRHITRHQIWTTNIKAYDNALPPGRSDVVRYSFRLPEKIDAGRGRRGDAGMTLRARVKYRRFNQEYANYVLGRQRREMVVPVVVMAETRVKIDAGMVKRDAGTRERGNAAPNGEPLVAGGVPQWKQWNDYGIGLLEQAQYGAAAEAFRRATTLNPVDADLLINVALAEMGTERFGPELDQYAKAAALLEAALRIDGQSARARFLRAQVWRAQGRVKEAAEELRPIAAAYPRDREVQRQLGQTLFALGGLDEARAAFEAIVALDPTDFGGWQFLAALYAGTNRPAESRRAQALFLQWRDDPVAEIIATRFFAAHPEWADERIRAHGHGRHSAGRPVLIGQHATPDK